ncbi:MAG TPA: hypothetical protein VFW68_12730 [Rhodocyclaceae bacterium]|nr:hypothetical protein [Rhodocyclaceae bacterium]
MTPLPARVRRLAPLALLLLLATSGIAWWIYESSQPTPPPRPPLAARQPVPAAPPAPQASAAPAEPPPITDIFAVRNWEPPPASPQASGQTKPQTKEPPPLPFRYLGRIVEAGKDDAFLLAQGNRVIAVSVGNVIDGTYRVEKYENGQLHFFYRPMKAHQTLAVGTMGNPS